MKKPTPAQRKVLEAMRDGGVLHWMGGLRPHAFMSEGLKTVSTATVLACDSGGWIKRQADGVSHFRYTLTDAGRAVLSGEAP